MKNRQEQLESKKRLNFIYDHLVELEKQKKLAVSSRNFKEAGKISNEIKDLTVEKEKINQKVNELATEMPVLENRLLSEEEQKNQKLMEISKLEEQQGLLFQKY